LFRNLRSNPGVILKVAFFQTFLLYTLFYSGMSRVPGALGAIIHGSGPLFAALVAHFMLSDDRLSFKKLVIISLGILGVVLVGIGRGSLLSDSPAVYIGITLLLLSNLDSGFSNVLISRDARNIPPIVMSSASMLAGGLMLLAVSVPLEGFSIKIFPAGYWFALVWLSFLSAAALTIWFTLLQRPGVKVSNLNIWKFVIPVFGAILSWILLPDEKPDMLTIAGMLITAVGLILLYRESN
jgi:drug/metabolite transporter (DMT)-like permease